MNTMAESPSGQRKLYDGFLTTMDAHPEMFDSLMNTMAEKQAGSHGCGTATSPPWTRIRRCSTTDEHDGREASGQPELWDSFLATMDNIRRCSTHCCTRWPRTSGQHALYDSFLATVDKHPEMFNSLMNTMAEKKDGQYKLFDSFLASVDNIRTSTRLMHTMAGDPALYTFSSPG